MVTLGLALVFTPDPLRAIYGTSGPVMAAGAVNTFRQFGYAFGIAVFGEVFRGGPAHDADPSLVGPLSGQAGAVIARGSDLAQLVHRAYAYALDLTFVVAAGFGLVAGIAVFVFMRPEHRCTRIERPSGGRRDPQARGEAEAEELSTSKQRLMTLSRQAKHT